MDGLCAWVHMNKAHDLPSRKHAFVLLSSRGLLPLQLRGHKVFQGGDNACRSVACVAEACRRARGRCPGTSLHLAFVMCARTECAHTECKKEIYGRQVQELFMLSFDSCHTGFFFGSPSRGAISSYHAHQISSLLYVFRVQFLAGPAN